MAVKGLIDAATKLTRSGNVTDVIVPVNLVALYPSALQTTFVTYRGSRTSPNCDEKVFWTVFLEPIFISVEQVNVLLN